MEITELEKIAKERNDALEAVLKTTLETFRQIEKDKQDLAEGISMNSDAILDLITVFNTLEERIISLEEEVNKLKGV